MSELDGFVVFRPTAEKPLYITPGNKATGMCAEVYKALGSPEYVNVFIDEMNNRVMIKRAEEGYENVIRVIQHTKGLHMSLCWKVLTDKLIAMFGRGRIYGHIAGDGMIIFDGKKR